MKTVRRGSRLRAALMRAILVSCVVLIALIVRKLTVIRCGRPPHEAYDVAELLREACGRAETARKKIVQIGRIERMGPLAEPERASVDAALRDLQASDERFRRLSALLHSVQAQDSDEMRDLRTYHVRTRVWILDAKALLLAPAEKGGLMIPLQLALHRSERLKGELQELERQAGGILERDDVAEKEYAREQVRRIRATLAACREELLSLEDDLQRELGGTVLSARDLPDLEAAREESSLLQQAMIGAGELSLRLRDTTE